MEYWTILWVTILSGQLDGVVYGIPYASEKACIEARSEVGASLDYDHSLSCETMPGNIASSSIRPKRRPEGLGE